MKTRIWVSYSYGSWDLSFSKTFDLPFTPFFGMMITLDDDDNTIELINTDHTHTIICYHVPWNYFEINVRIHWQFPVTDDEVDSILETYAEWEREDNTDIPRLKILMAAKR